MNEDYSDLIKNFSNILKEKNIDVKSIISSPSHEQNNTQNETKEQYSHTSNTNTSNDFNIGIDDIIKIKNIFETMNSEENSNRNTLLHSLKPYLPTQKKEKLEQLIKLSSLLTALELLEHKNIFGIDLNSNTIIIIILILIIL
jgi:hypothetical protein